MKYKSKLELLSSSLIQVSLVLALMITTIQSGYFDKINVEVGQAHYAEETPPWVPKNWLPYFSMPANTLVNVGYILVGLYWLVMIKENDYWVSVFCWMSIFYGPVQLYRIVNQSIRSAVLDQWVTLPFFAWMYHWTCQKLNYKIKSRTGITIVSLASFVLAIFTQNGFEISLAVHMLMVLSSSLFVLIQFHNSRAIKYFTLALFSSLGFVLLKVLDLKLAELYPGLFTVLSGHFWSKICDFLQIHFCCLFVSSIEKKVK